MTNKEKQCEGFTPSDAKELCQRCGETEKDHDTNEKQCCLPFKNVGVHGFNCTVRQQTIVVSHMNQDWENFVNKIWERGHVPEWANDVKTGIIQEGNSLLKSQKKEMVEKIKDMGENMKAGDKQLTVEEALAVMKVYEVLINKE